uniref:Exocyst subunit Exo70 family protein n=1 Tax=Caenorhabditis tropicalis TaxID=1561998 RepID=A0A1I7UP25_9PELO
MYGSPGELIQNLRIYSDFPSNHQLFEFDVTESYNTRVIKYQSLSGDSFIYKQDMFSLMQRMMTKQLEDETLQSILIIFLKYYEGFLAESCEFIKYDAEWINKLEKDLVELWQKAMTLMLPPPTQPPDYRQMYRRFKEMSPEWAEQDFIPINWIYEKAHAGLLPNLPSSSIRFLRYLGIGFRKFFISKREYLTPYSVMNIHLNELSSPRASK